MDLYDVVKKLTGPINPIGDSRADEDRLANLKATCDLVGRLVADIDAVSDDRGDHMASVKIAKCYAEKFLLQLTE